MDINDIILSDKALDLVDNGTWIGDLDELPGVELYVTGLQSDSAQKLMRSKQAAQRAKNRNKPLTDDQQTAIVREVLGEVVLNDWRGFTSNGKPLEFDRETVRKWLMLRNGEKLATAVLVAAQRVDQQAAELAKELSKN